MANANIRGLYYMRHGGSSWAEEAYLDFSDNSNPIGPPRGFAEAVQEAAARGVYERFPAHLAEEVLTEYEGVRVTLFNGATEALLYAFLELKPRRALIVWPTYGDYARIAEVLGIPYLFIPPWGVERAGPGDLVVLCNPNNPTGAYLPRDWVVDVAKKLKARGAQLFVDESFMDFVDGRSAAPDVPVVKSYGKFLATPGLRVGGALFEIRHKPPWRINSIVDYAIWRIGAEGLREHKRATIAFIAAEKPRVLGALRRCVPVASSSVHFHVVFSDPPRGVKVRPLEDKGIKGFRFSLKSPRQNDALVEAVCGHVH